MFASRSINADHKDLIHDVAYDFYGRRMATCSSDQTVKVWDMGEEDDIWRCTATWKSHTGSVWKVTWAHYTFGSVIATCSFDRTAVIWEEIVGEAPAGQERGQSHWIKKASLVDSRTAVTDIRFSPRHLGLQLATSSSDGIVRVYKATDQLNLSQWSLVHEISCKLACSCVSWGTSGLHPPMLAIGCDDSAAGAKVFIYEYSESARRFNRVETLTNITEPVHDLTFAPYLGRSFLLLAVASKDVCIVVVRPVSKEDNPRSIQGSIHSSSQSASSNANLSASLSANFNASLNIGQGNTQFDIKTVAQFPDHNSSVWRVSWNITGTLLASSGDDGQVRLWKAERAPLVWKNIAVIKGDGSGPATDVMIPPLIKGFTAAAK